MKPLKLICLLFFLLSLSCSSDDDATTASINAPTVSYTNTTLDATFFQNGNSTAPTIAWNGNQGSFSTATSITGLTINTTTGVLNWTKNLPIGTHNLQVIASNNAGQTIINITINNLFQGVFTGTYSGSVFYEFEFNSDGSLLVRANDSNNPSTASGAWTRNGSNIITNYTYDDVGLEYSTSGTLTIGTTAVYAGEYFNGFGTVSGNEDGTFVVTLN